MSGDVSAVSWAAFSGTLQVLDLDTNALGGSVEDWAAAGLGGLAALRYCGLGANRLSGGLRPFAALPSLLALLLHGNRLSGPLPEELMQHPQLRYLDADNNRLNGTLPAAIFLAQPLGSSSSNSSSNGSSSSSGGGGSSSSSGSTGVNTLLLSGNLLNGSLPDLPSGAVLTGELSYLDLSNNSLSGPLPRYLPRLALSYLDASHNRLAGPVAPLLRGAWSLGVLRLDDNGLSGTLPEVVAAKHLQALDLSSNRLTGTLPDALGGLAYLARLDLAGNAGLGGRLPPGLGSHHGLEGFDVT
ncbi:hypothetical protein HYH02_011905, partial [Chlamydomonas schloesseri]